MSPRHERNDPRGRRNGAPSPQRSASAPRRADDGGAEWLWGRHAVAAALANPGRPAHRRLAAVAGRAEEVLRPLAIPPGALPAIEAMGTNEIGRLLPAGAVHQGVALLTEPLAPVALADLAEPARGLLVLLDQVADPQNVGAVMRSAAAFGARGLILQDRRAPPLSGVLAKAAAGAVDRIACARVVNLSRALETLEAAGWRAVGLDTEAEAALADVVDATPTVLVLGSEGEGLRRLVSEHCDVLARIPMPGGFESLNVASAATVALYEAARAQGAARA